MNITKTLTSTILGASALMASVHAQSVVWSEGFEGSSTGVLVPATSAPITDTFTTDTDFVTQGTEAYVFSVLPNQSTVKFFDIFFPSDFHTHAVEGNTFYIDVTSVDVTNWNKMSLSAFNSVQNTVQFGQIDFTPSASKTTLAYTFTAAAEEAIVTNEGKFQIAFLWDSSIAPTIAVDNLRIESPIPEPSTYAAVFSLITLGLIVFKKRRRS